MTVPVTGERIIVRSIIHAGLFEHRFGLVHLRMGFLHLCLSRHQLGLCCAQLGLARLEIRLRGIVLGDGSVIGRLGGLDIVPWQQATRELCLLLL
jgi:hypothetical protein